MVELRSEHRFESANVDSILPVLSPGLGSLKKEKKNTLDFNNNDKIKVAIKISHLYCVHYSNRKE